MATAADRERDRSADERLNIAANKHAERVERTLYSAYQDCERFMLLHLKSAAVRDELHGEIMTDLSVVGRSLNKMCYVMNGGCPTADLSKQYLLDGSAWWKGPNAEVEAWQRASMATRGAANDYLALNLDFMNSPKPVKISRTLATSVVALCSRIDGNMVLYSANMKDADAKGE